MGNMHLTFLLPSLILHNLQNKSPVLGCHRAYQASHSSSVFLFYHLTPIHGTFGRTLNLPCFSHHQVLLECSCNPPYPIV